MKVFNVVDRRLPMDGRRTSCRLARGGGGRTRDLRMDRNGLAGLPRPDADAGIPGYADSGRNPRPVPQRAGPPFSGGPPHRLQGEHRAAWGLASAAYEERLLPSGHLDPARLSILADAFEESGCDDPGILDYLRGPGPHVRGCWCLDLLLEKE